MADIINNPGNSGGESTGMGMIVGVLIAIIVIVLFFMYGLPVIRGGEVAPAEEGDNVNIDVTLPSGTSEEAVPAE